MPPDSWDWETVRGRARRDLDDPALLHRIAPVPLLVRTGLGADGASSSADGPSEARAS